MAEPMLIQGTQQVDNTCNGIHLKNHDDGHQIQENQALVSTPNCNQSIAKVLKGFQDIVDGIESDIQEIIVDRFKDVSKLDNKGLQDDIASNPILSQLVLKKDQVE